MTPHVSLESAALHYCKQALRRVAPRTATATGRVSWMLPELARLIAEEHDRDPRAFVASARRFVDEHTFIDDAGDPLFDDHVNEETQALIEMSVRVHRAVHHRAVSHEAPPVPPLMCG
ncbi:MAG: hypothetical protein AAF333_11315 [Planctomycetota bacterium]